MLSLKSGTGPENFIRIMATVGVLCLLFLIDIIVTVNSRDNSQSIMATQKVILQKLDEGNRKLEEGNVQRERLTANQDRLFRSLLARGVISE